MARIDKIRSKLREVRGRNMWKIKEWFLHYKEAIRVSLLALFRWTLLAVCTGVLCGGIGAGNTTKLANQIIVACNIQAVKIRQSRLQAAEPKVNQRFIT